ncbi:MAG: elongation factor P hydroxylase [Alcanivorax sp.]|nr:elongation factor P hydroxylase [Alcanivorax sp.]
MHRAADLEALFHDTFHADYVTVLEGGFEEPVYLPGEPHRIRYTRDYFRSALHEVAHWCVAGPRRRTLEDYGYWYAPDGRDAAQQARFLTVEVRPQAFEALFCAACGHRFRVSLDNLDGDPGDADRFAAEVACLARRLIEQGLPERPRRWVAALETFYGTADRPLAARLAVLFPATP